MFERRGRSWLVTYTLHNISLILIYLRAKIKSMSYSRLNLSGSDAFSFLQRQCSQDLAGQQDAYAAFLSPKAELVALSYVIAEKGCYAIITAHDHAPTLKSHLEKFIILDDVTLTLEEDLGDIILPQNFALDDFTPKQQLMKIAVMNKYVSFTKGCYPGQEVVAKWSNAGQRKRNERAQKYIDEALSLHAGIGHSEAKQSFVEIATPPTAARNDSEKDPDGSFSRSQPRVQDTVATAIELLRKSLKEDPQNEEAMEALGVMLARQGKYQDAIRVLQQLELINPKSIMAKANLSILYMKLGDKERAEQYKAEGTVLQFEQALKSH